MGGNNVNVSDTPEQLTQEAQPAESDFQDTGVAVYNSAGAAHQQSLDLDLRNALQANRIADARTLIANAEAILIGHEAGAPPHAEGVSRDQVAAAKARIAIATGDAAAAKAILVTAIERQPDAAVLRALMTEVMLSEGRATDVRPVLQHLGNRPQDDHKAPPGVRSDPKTQRDTSR